VDSTTAIMIVREYANVARKNGSTRPPSPTGEQQAALFIVVDDIIAGVQHALPNIPPADKP
jgi:hypothetical protein